MTAAGAQRTPITHTHHLRISYALQIFIHLLHKQLQHISWNEGTCYISHSLHAQGQVSINVEQSTAS